MMKKLLLFFSLSLFSATLSFAGSGIFESYAVIGGVYFDLGATTANADFNGYTFTSTYAAGATLNIGGEVKTFRNGSDNICGAKIWYSIYPAAGSPGTFTSVTLPFGANINASDQSWIANPGTGVVLPTAPGAYKIAVYVTDSGDGSGGCTQDPFHTVNNTGANYIANITVCGTGSGALAAGTYTVGTGGCFATIQAAATYLNANGVAGPVVFNVAPGHTETAAAGGIQFNAITGTSATNTITIQKVSGAATNPKVTAAASQTSGFILDACIRLVGTDYITFDGIDVAEGAGVTTAIATNNMTEAGYGIFNASTTDGCQNVTIKNCTITMNKTYQNAFGVFSNNTALGTNGTSQAAGATAASANLHNNLKIYGNTITNTAMAIVVLMPVTTATLSMTGLDIGGSSAATGNTITNFGNNTANFGYTNMGTTQNAGIYMRNVTGYNCSYNTINDNAFAITVLHYGILGVHGTAPSGVTATSTANNNTVTVTQTGIVGVAAIDMANGGVLATMSYTANNNTVSVTQTSTVAATGGMQGINMAYGGASSTYSATGNTVTITQNNNGAVAFSGAILGITAATACTNTTMNTNIITITQNISAAGTYSGAVTGITMAGIITGIGELKDNQIKQWIIRTTSTNYFFNANAGHTGTMTVSGNTTSGSSTPYVTRGGTTTAGTLYGYYNFASAASGTTNVYNNTFSEISITGTMAFTGIQETNGGTGQTKLFYNNTVSNISGGTTGAINCLYGGYAANISIYNNTVNNVTGGGTVTGITAGTGALIVNAYSNTVSNLTSTGTASVVTGMSISGSSSGTSLSAHKNKVYNLTNNAAGSVQCIGIAISAGNIWNIHNNFISGLFTTASTNVQAQIGINANAGTNANVNFNTVKLSGTGGTGFGATGIQFSSSYTAFNCKNNILNINCTPVGTGMTMAIRRSAVGTTGTPPTSAVFASDNNIYYVPAAAYCYVYGEGTTNTTAGTTYKNCFGLGSTADDNTNYIKHELASVFNSSCSKYKSWIGSGHEANCFTEDNLSTVATGTFAPTGLSYAESKGATSTTPAITDDYSSVTRSGTPDIGALEFSGTAVNVDATAPTIAYTAYGNNIFTTTRTVTATISDAVGVTAARLYYKPTAEADAYGANDNTVAGWKYVVGSNGGSGNTWTFIIDYSLMQTPTTTLPLPISYFIVAQDAANNVSTSTATYTAGYCPSSVNISGTTTTATNAYNIVPSISGTYYVGSASCGGNAPTYATLTAAVADYNTKGLAGAVTFLLTDAAYTEAAQVVINANSDASATNTLTIKPCTGVTTTVGVTGGSTTGIIKLNGADYVTIDGSNAGTTSKDLTIENTNTGTSSGVVWIASASTTDGATNNTIKNTIIKGNASTTTLMGIFSGYTTAFSTSGNALVANSNNTISNNTIMKAQYGIYLKGKATVGSTDVGNKIQNNSVGTSTTGEGFSIEAIHSEYQTSAIIENNDVQNVTNTSTSNYIGINILNNNLSIIRKNKIHGIYYTGTTTGKAYGIYNDNSAYTTVGNPSSNQFLNNFVYDLTSTGTSGSWNTSGITNHIGYGDKYYHNSVYLTGQMSNTGTAGSAAFDNGNGITATAGTNLDVRNNIFYMAGSSLAAAKLYAVYAAAPGTSYAFMDNNILVSSSPTPGSATNVLGFYSAADRADLTAWKTATTRDVSSYSVNPGFVSATDLHINTALTPNMSENTGANVGITEDIDAEIRPDANGAANGGGTLPDIGADEIDGVPYPFMTYTSTTAYQSSTTICPSAVTNQQIMRVEVVTNGLLNPLVANNLAFNTNGTTTVSELTNAKLYYTGNSATFATTTQYGSTVAAPNGAFTFNGATNLASGTNYFWLTYDIAASPVGPNFDAELSAVTVSTTPYTITGTASAPSGILSIGGPLAGTYTIGATGNFTNLTSAITQLTCRGVSGAVTLSLASDYSSATETFPITIPATIANVSASNTITIKPGSGVSSSISGTSATAIIVLDGADYITIDGANTAGGTTKNLSITNNSTASSTAVIWVKSAGTGLGATFNTVKNCNLTAGVTSVATFGIIAAGASISTTGTGDDNDDLTIQNNTITKAQYGIYVSALSTTGAGLVNNLNISQNTIGATGAVANSIGLFGIYLRNLTAATVTQNELLNMSSGSNYGAIAIQTAVTNSSFTRNLIHDLINTGTNRAAGFEVSGSASASLTFANNIIYGVMTNGTSGTQYGGVGINLLTGGGYNIYNNTVNLSGNRNTISGTISSASACINVESVVTALDIRNNILVNTQTEAASGIKSYAIYSGAGIGTFTTINNNDYFVSGAQGVLGFLSSARTDLAGIITGFGGNANSVNINPTFVSATDFHVTNVAANCAIKGKGAAIATVTTDYDGDARHATRPGIGADELSPAPFVTSISGTNPACVSTVLTANTDPTSGLTYAWGNPTTAIAGETSATYTATVTGAYNVTITDAIGCSATASANKDVTINSLPTANAGIDVTVNCTTPSTTLTATGGTSYAWSNSAIQGGSVSPTVTTTYVVTVTANGCSSVDDVTVTVDKTAPTANAGADATVNCTTPSTTLTATGGTSYAWNNSATQGGSVTPTATTTYIVTVTAANGCTATDDVTVTVDKTAPTANAGADVTLNCTTTSTTLTATGGASYKWNDATAATTASIVVGTGGNYTVTVTAANGCTATDDVSITVDNAAPTANAGADATVNCTTPSTTLTATSGASYAWSSGQAIASFSVSPTATTTYTVTVTGANGCTATDDVTITVDKTAPTANAGADATVNVTTPSTTLTATGGASYAWSNGTLTAANSVSPTVTTTYVVTVTGANGCSATDDVTVTADVTPPTANAGADVTVNCTTSSTILTATGGTSYLWSTTATTAAISVSPTVTTVYTVTVTAANGATATDDVTVTANFTAPTANAGADVTINCTTPSATLTASSSSPIGAGGFAWNNGATQGGAVTPATTTTYVVTVTGANGCTATDDVTVTVDKTAPTANAGSDVTVTCASPSATLTATGGTGYAWSNGANTATTSVTPSTTTVYTVTVTAANGCKATDDVAVAADQNIPTVNAGADVTVTCTSPSATLTATSSAGTLLWSTNAVTASISVTPTVTTTYNVTITAANGCQVSDAVVVTVDKVLPTADAGADITANCTTPTATLTATGGTSYAWSNSVSQGVAFTPVTSRNYTVTVTGANGCKSTDAVFVAVDKTAPTANAGADATVTCTTPSTTLTATGGTGFAWSNGTATAANSVSPTANTTYTVTVTGANGCKATDDVAVVVNQTAPTANAGADATVTCAASSAVLTAAGGVSYAWSNGTATAANTVSPTTNTTYTVTVTAANGCKATDGVVVVVDKAAPTANAGADVSVDCTTSSATLTATGGVSYTWSSGATTATTTVSPASTTTYIVTVTGANGCKATDDVLVFSNKGSFSATVSPDVTLTCANPTTTLTASGGSSYLWNNGSTTPSITVTVGATTTYYVTITGGNGCAGSEDIVVTYNNIATVSCPAAITANVDVMECYATNVFLGLPTVTGVCTIASSVPSFAGGSVNAATHFPTGVNTVTWTVTDGGANVHTCAQTVTVKDNILPGLSVPINATISCSDPVPAMAAGIATDNCAIASLTRSQTTTQGAVGACAYSTYTITRTWVATDVNGNSKTASQVITVRDNTAPVLSTVPANTTINQTGVYTVATLTATDNCSAATVSVTTSISTPAIRPACYSVYENIVNTWTATDVCGNTSTGKQIITRADLVQLTCPANLVLNTNSDGVANDNCSTVVKASNNVNPVFSDICDLSVLKHNVTGATTITNGNGSVAGLVFNKGLSTVVYSALGRTCSFTITINDNEAPKIANTNLSVVEDACTFGAVAPASPIATDNCAVVSFTVGSDVTATVSGCSSKAATLKYFQVKTRTWIATDAASNAVSAVQKVYLRDMVAPTVICKDITVTSATAANANVAVPATAIDNGSSDNCTATGALSYAICRGASCTNFAANLSLSTGLIPTGQTFVIIPVTLRVIDACGNVSMCNANIRYRKFGTTLANNNSTTTLAETADTAIETPPTPTVPSEIDATHGSMKCFPNPFADDLNINYNLTSDVENVVIKVYDNQSRLVKVNTQGESLAGYYQMRWNLADLPSGMYHVCLEADGKCLKVERVVLTK